MALALRDLSRETTPLVPAWVIIHSVMCDIYMRVSAGQRWSTRMQIRRSQVQIPPNVTLGI